MSEAAPAPATGRLPRPPLALGCVGLLAALALVVVIVVVGVVFLESGSDSGKATLDAAASYAPGSVTFVGERNLYIVRLGNDFIALSDLDAANRAAAGQRCRVAPVAADDPKLPGLIARLASRQSTQAAGTTLLYREDCFGAVYDAAGVRLDGDGPNLDRYPVDVDASGRLVVNTAQRQCTQREQGDDFAPIAC